MKNPKIPNYPWIKRHRALLKEFGNSLTASVYIIKLRKREKGDRGEGGVGWYALKFAVLLSYSAKFV